MKLTIKKATTSKIIHIFISDSSATDGSGLTGLLYNSASLVAYYVKPGDATATVITLANIATLGTYVSGGFKEYDATNMPGLYEFHPPNACLTTAAQVVIMLKGAANMAPLPLEIQLDDNTVKDAYDIVNSGAYGNAQLVRSTTPANALDVNATGEAGIDLDNTSGALAKTTDITGFNDIAQSDILSDATAFPGASITEVRLAELAAANLPADIDTLLTRITAAVALASICTETRLAELDAGNIPTDLSTINAYVDELETRLTAARAGYLDNLSAGAAALASVCTAGRLGELDAANLPADIDTLLTRITAAVALASICTETRLAELGATNIPADIDTLLARLTAGRATALDNIPEGIPKNADFSNLEFLMVDSTDHVSPKTGLTLSAQRSINGGAFAAVSGSLAEVGSGIYQFDALAADLNGDVITFRFYSAGADDTFLTIKTTS